MGERMVWEERRCGTWKMGVKGARSNIGCGTVVFWQATNDGCSRFAFLARKVVRSRLTKRSESATSDLDCKFPGVFFLPYMHFVFRTNILALLNDPKWE